jgi:hypothetical protein
VKDPSFGLYVPLGQGRQTSDPANPLGYAYVPVARKKSQKREEYR